MKHELAGIPAWAYIMGMPAVLVAAATPALLAVASLLPPNFIWLGYLMPVVLASVRWGFASAVATAVTAGLAGDFFFTQPYYSLWMDDSSDAAALLLFLLVAFGSALAITNLRQANHGVSQPQSAADTPLPEVSELADRETPAAAADYACDPRFSYEWRTSLTTILGAAGVLLMRGKGTNRLDRTLLTDIRDEAVSLSQLLANAFPASRAAESETRSGQIGPGASAAINPGKKPH